MRRLFLTGVLVFLLPLWSAAETVHPPIEAYGALPNVRSVTLSPSGKRFAMIVSDGTTSSLLAFDLTGEKAESILSSGLRNAHLRGINFVTEDTIVLSASETSGSSFVRKDYEYSGALSVDLRTAEMEQLMYRTRDLHPFQSGIGRYVGVDQRTGALLMPAFTGTTNSAPLDLFRNELGKSMGRRIARGRSHTRDWFVDADGNPIAREDFNVRAGRHRVILLKGSQETIYEREDIDLPELNIVGVAPDGEGLTFIGTTATDFGEEALFRLGFDGQITGPLLTRPETEIDRLYMSSSRVVMGVRHSGMTPTYSFFDPELQSRVDTLIESTNGAVFILDWSDDYSRVLYRVYNGYAVDTYYVHDSTTGQLLKISDSRTDIPPEAVGTFATIEYAARDGLTIPAILTIPPGKDLDPGSNFPLIVMPHGGPAAYDRVDFDWLAQFFANRGYLVFQPNFRGSSGFGAEFQRAGHGEWGAKMQDDITDGVVALKNSNLVDPDRICIIGASYGGYAALAGGAFTPDLYKCVASIAGVSDINLMLTNERQRHGRHSMSIAYWKDAVADGETNRQKLDAVSPAKHAEQFQAPVLLIHGDDDTVVDINHSVRMNRALRRAGKDVEFERLKGEDHWLSNGETRLATLKSLHRFVDTHIGPQAGAEETGVR